MDERAVSETVLETVLEKAEGADHCAGLGLLPRSVRLLGAGETGLCEFEVVNGNAAYREGERFYLSAAKAQKAYPATRLF